jgi:hypothetical protein
MKTINDLISTFDALKPGIAADFTAQVTRSIEELIPAYGAGIRKLHAAYGADGNKFRAVRHFIQYDSNSMNATPTGIKTEYLATKAQQYADDQIAAFTIKLVKKLGTLTDVEIHGLSMNAFTFRISGRLGERAVYVEQSRIINVSPLGNLFHQWPALIYVDGKKTSEAAFKALAA